ncbi:helix-turn-helix transcriptional regulator [Flavobacterium alkalisoli]|uniref:Helix-turn-helix transcriptional regulator n=1 Tax=Flavobacterium alkalisoli TaxID=2602769 RepID=A0A5B9FPB7_9FLAO|nr:helix-turn-helix transcriptional regulator [Flavobacterium alkalisoli]QEE48655.1 helix-turn-helix transcriptional regulator [Flavobacterium alkalisoli]
MFGKNLKKIRSVRNMSQQEFSELFDLKRATLGAYEEERSNPKIDTVIKIANYFSIGLEELLTKELTVNRLLRFNEAITTESSYNNDDFDTIPCITEEVKTRYLDNFANNISNEDLPTVKLPHVTGKDKMAFVIDDLTMSGGTNGFFPKDTIIGANVPLTELANLSGELSVVITKDQLYFRKLTYNNNTVMLTANHPGVEPVLLSTGDIKAAWRIIHVFRYTMHSDSNALEQRLAQLENTIASLRQKPW